MKLITRDTDYAVRALCYIAGQKHSIVTVTEMVNELGIPRPFLRKILQILNKKTLLNSFKGKNGGFSLAVKPEKIYLTDLMKIFQGVLRLNECIFKKKICPDKSTCPLRQELDGVEKQVIERLKKVTVASLLEKGGAF